MILDRALFPTDIQNHPKLSTIAVTAMSIPQIDVARLLSAHSAPGISLAVVENGAIERVIVGGVRDATTRAPVTERTVFEAASLSKPVFAYAVLQLADAGVLLLDAPLPLPDRDVDPADPRVALITARHVLTHRTGLPNWRGSRPLQTYFPPGERFSYSGEGFVLLQRAVERIAGEPLDAVVSRLVFAPLGMRDSSFVWQTRFEPDYADPHDEAIQPGSKLKPAEANAAFSLQTTVADYARFLLAVLGAERLTASTARLWLTPQVNPPQGRFESLEAAAPERDLAVAWGFGWGLEPDHGTFFHWGSNPGANAFAIGSRASGTALVMFANGDNGVAAVPEVVASLFPGHRPALAWLGYGARDP